MLDTITSDRVYEAAKLEGRRFGCTGAHIAGIAVVRRRTRAKTMEADM